MAAKKKTPSAQLRPIRRGAADNMERRASVKSGGQSPVDMAARAIRQRYGNKVGGDIAGGRQTMRQFVQSFQDVVAESSLVDRFASRTLDAAAKKVATEQYAKYVGGTEDKAKARKKKK